MIIVDTREQKPLWNTKDSNIISLKLDEGDYTTSELKGFAHIERKSGNDLYGSIIQGHARFREELRRAREKELYLAVFVECPKEIFIGKRFKGGFRLKTHPAVLRKIVHTIEKKYEIEFVWCKDREHMRSEAIKWFEMMRVKKNGKTAAVQA